MSDIKFSFETLFEVISKDDNLKKIDREDILSNKLSNKDKQKIIDLLLERFCSEGLGSNDEPNNLGIELEKIIDFFNR